VVQELLWRAARRRAQRGVFRGDTDTVGAPGGQLLGPWVRVTVEFGGGTGDGRTHGGERPVRTLVGGQLDRAPTGSDDPFAGFVDGDAVQHRPQIWRFRLRHRCPSSILCVVPMQLSVTGAGYRSQRQYRTNEEISPCIHASVRTHRTGPWPGAGTGRCSVRGWRLSSFPWALC